MNGMSTAVLDLYSQAFAEGYQPDEAMRLSDWADRYRILSGDAAAEPGRWRTDRTPYLREIMDCLSPDSPVREVVFMKGSQVGGTESGLNWLGYVIHVHPGPIMMVQPTLDQAQRYSKRRVDPMVEECEELRSRIRPARARDSGNTVFMKEFPGGALILTGANSAKGLRMMPIRDIFADEVDQYPGDVDGEGDPIDLARARQRTFPRGKCLQVSSPTNEGQSRISRAYEDSSKGRFYVPCPHCGCKQWLRWERVKWEKDQPKTAHYLCEGCEGQIENYQKSWMLEHGEWVHEFPEHRTRGFHLSALYSPVGWYSWVDAARDFLDAQSDPMKLKVFINTVLGETWRESGERPQWQRLYRQREDYTQGIVPEGALILTAGVDVQKDRLEIEIVGWGPGRETWSVDYRVLEGDTAQQAVWARLTLLLADEFQHESDAWLGIMKLAIDSGYNTGHVYTWARQQGPGRVMVCKGNDSGGPLVMPPASADVRQDGKRVRRGLKVWPIATHTAKSELYGFLRLNPPLRAEDLYPPGFCHFPQYDEEHFRRLTAEEYREHRDRRNFTKGEWVKTRERNEPLDCRVLARAAAYQLGMDRWQPQHWEALRGYLKAPEPEQAKVPPPKAQGDKVGVRSKFLGG